MLTTDQAYFEKWAQDILTTVFEKAEIYSTVDGDDRVLELCSHSAFANAEELKEAIAKDLKDGIDNNCDACMSEARASV